MYVTDAKPSQATEIASLIQSVGEHLPLYLWQIESGGHSSPLEVGARRIASSKDSSNFSYQNARVCMEGGRIVAACIGLKLPDNPSLRNWHEHAEPLIPLLMLQMKAASAWNIYLLSVDESARQKGVAKLLMRDAELLALEHGCAEVALFVNSENKPALSLCGSLGYVSKDQVPVVPYPNCPSNSNWVLLSKPAPMTADHVSDSSERRLHNVRAV